jgi:hypothetical protein
VIFIRDQLNPDYRLGNQLFSYNLLRQIATAAHVPYAHPPFRERRWFKDMEGTCERPKDVADALKLTQRELLDRDREELLGTISQLEKDSRDVELVQPILGDTFFRYSMIDPNELIRMRRQYRSHGVVKPERKQVAVHFRGNDFFRWDPRAVLNFEYYRNALELCVADVKGSLPVIRLFTDDPHLEAYKSLVAHIRSNYPGLKTIRGMRLGNPLVDLWQMGQCDYLISTPSTFAFWGGVFGKPKKIVQSKQWIEQQILDGVVFWKEMVGSRLPCYSIWRQV